MCIHRIIGSGQRDCGPAREGGHRITLHGSSIRIEFLTNLLDTDPSETGTDHSDRPQVVQPVGYDDGDVA